MELLGGHADEVEVVGHHLDCGRHGRRPDDEAAPRPPPHACHLVVLQQPDRLAQHSAAHAVPGGEVRLGPEHLTGGPAAVDDLRLDLPGDRGTELLTLHRGEPYRWRAHDNYRTLFSMTLAGKNILITGAARGLGREYADLAVADGAVALLADVDGDGAARAAEEVRAAGGQAHGFAVDVTDEASTQQLAKEVEAEVGTVDVLVNNAGIWGDLHMGPVLTTELEHWDLVMAVNVKGPLLCARALLPLMPDGSRIVNISSVGAYMPGGVYPVSKLALNQLTYQLAIELGHRGITVNGVAPGPIDNEATRRQVPAEGIAQLIGQIPLGRGGTAADLWGMIRYLSSDDASWVTGQTLLVNGGFMTRF